MREASDWVEGIRRDEWVRAATRSRTAALEVVEMARRVRGGAGFAEAPSVSEGGRGRSRSDAATAMRSAAERVPEVLEVRARTMRQAPTRAMGEGDPKAPGGCAARSDPGDDGDEEWGVVAEECGAARAGAQDGDVVEAEVSGEERPTEDGEPERGAVHLEASFTGDQDGPEDEGREEDSIERRGDAGHLRPAYEDSRPGDGHDAEGQSCVCPEG